MPVFDKNYKPKDKSEFDTSLFTKFQVGDNKIRILSKAVIGYSWWSDKKKTVVKTINDIPSNVPQGGRNGYKEFYAFKIYNHTLGTVQLMEVTQSSIKRAIYQLDNSEDWGDIREYDININRVGEGMETEYTVTPTPKKELKPEILESVERVKLDWDKYFDGEPPFIFPEKKDEEVNPKEIPF